MNKTAMNAIALKKTILSFLIIVALVTNANAEPNYPKDLWKGLIAEAVSDDYEGMYAVACVVRNRLKTGMDDGLAGLHRKDLNRFIYKQGQYYWQMARAIEIEVFYHNAPDVTDGALYFENIRDFGKPRWAKNMIVTVKIGEHVFYKFYSKLARKK